MAQDIRAHRGGLRASRQWRALRRLRRRYRGTILRWPWVVAIALLIAGSLLGFDAKAAVSDRPDKTWGADGRVLAIVTTSTRIYVGGTFTHAVSPTGTTVVRNNLMAVDPTTGALDLTFRPEPNGEVDSLAVSPDGTRIYVGGTFSTIGAGSRRNLAAVDAVTGANVSTWRADADHNVLAKQVVKFDVPKP